MLSYGRLPIAMRGTNPNIHTVVCTANRRAAPLYCNAKFCQLIAIDTIAWPFQIAEMAASSSAGPRQAKFQLLTDEELDDSASTKRSLKFGWQRLEAFAKFTNTSLTDISRENLDQLLSSFYASAQKEDGTTYSKRSIQAIRYAVQRHYFDEQGVDICDKSTFPRSIKFLKQFL